MATLRELRDNAFLTQEALAEKAGVSRGLISCAEVGLAVPNRRSVKKLADALGVAFEIVESAVLESARKRTRKERAACPKT